MPAGQNLFANKIKLKLKSITILCDRLILSVVEILIYGQCQMVLMSKGIKFLNCLKTRKSFCDRKSPPFLIFVTMNKMWYGDHN